MAFLRQELAIDLGTAKTVIFKDDQVVLDEPSIIATDTKTRNGVWLAGGGLLLRGIAKRFAAKVNIDFHVAKDPLKAVARGTCLALKGSDRYPFMMK